MSVARHLITGAAGVIGFEVTRQLLAAGQQVIAVDNFLKGGQQDLANLCAEFPSSLKVIEGDLISPETLKAVEGEIDTIFHFAAIVGVAYVNKHPYETLNVNLRTTLNVTDFAKKRGCRALVFASSSENYASAVEKGWVELPTTEDVPLCIDEISLPRWSYAASKIAGESAVFAAARESKFIPLVLRFHNVYGPRMGLTHVIPELLDRCAREVKPFPVYGYDATRSFLHVEDAARAVCLVAKKASDSVQGVFNIGSADEVSIADLVRLCFEVSKFEATIEKHSAPPGSVKRRVPDISRVKALGFTPSVSLSNGLAACYDNLSNT